MTFESSIPFQIPEQYYTTLFNAMPGNSILVMANAPIFTILAATPEYITNSGYAEKSLIGKGVFEAFPANHTDPSHNGDRDLLASFQHVHQYKEPHFLPLQRCDLQVDDGSFTEKYWKASNRPVFSPEGEIIYIMHTAEDITELVMAGKREVVHQELRRAFRNVEQSEAALQQFKFMADNAQDPFILMREDGTFAYVNGKALEAWGYSEEEAKNIRVPDVDPVYQDEAYKQLFAKAQTETIPQFETLHKHKDGHIYPVEVSVNGITIKGKSHLFAVARNINERKHTEEELRQSEDRFRTMVNAVPQSIWITDAEGRTEFLNKHWCDYCGVPYSQTTAADIAVNHLHPEDGPRVMHLFKEAMKTGEPWEVEQRNRSKEGEYRWFLNRATPYKDPVTGHVLKWFGVGIDIHDRKLAEQAFRLSEEGLEKKIQERTKELAKANEELKRSNQNLEEFAYAASHDLKEPMRKIQLFSDRLNTSLQEKLSSQDQGLFNRIIHATNRMNTLIDDLLMYSHVSRGVELEERVDLNQKISRVLEDLEVEIEEKKAVINVDSLPTIKGHRRQLQQLFQNLIGNAIKYHKPGVSPEVYISCRKPRPEEWIPVTTAKPIDQYYLIEVSDNGIGFDPDDADRIFNVFTRLHGNAEYKGTGVGLSIAKKVVENHGGYIWGDGKPGEGANFQVLLPD